MQFGPCLDEPLLALRERTRYQFHRLDPVHGDMLLIIGMKVRCVMPSVNFDIHANDDPKESAEFRHALILENRSIHRKGNLAKHLLRRRRRTGTFSFQR